MKVLIGTENPSGVKRFEELVHGLEQQDHIYKVKV